MSAVTEYTLFSDEGTVAKWMISMVESEATAIQMCDFSSDQPLAVSFIQVQ